MNQAKNVPPGANLLRYFATDHLPYKLRLVSAPFRQLAETIVSNGFSGDPAETVVAVRKLLEAKDSAVRAVLDSRTEHLDRWLRPVVDLAVSLERLDRKDIVGLFVIPDTMNYRIASESLRDELSLQLGEEVREQYTGGQTAQLLTERHRIYIVSQSVSAARGVRLDWMALCHYTEQAEKVRRFELASLLPSERIIHIPA